MFQDGNEIFGDSAALNDATPACIWLTWHTGSLANRKYQCSRKIVSRDSVEWQWYALALRQQRLRCFSIYPRHWIPSLLCRLFVEYMTLVQEILHTTVIEYDEFKRQCSTSSIQEWLDELEQHLPHARKCRSRWSWGNRNYISLSASLPLPSVCTLTVLVHIKDNDNKHDKAGTQLIIIWSQTNKINRGSLCHSLSFIHGSYPRF